MEAERPTAIEASEKRSTQPELEVNVKPCKFCGQPIPLLAKVCYHCGRPQAAWKIHHLELTSLVSAVVAIGLLLLGFFQFQEAKRDRIKADEALKRATSTARALEVVVTNQRTEAAEITKTISDLFSDVCDAFEGSFDSSSYSCVLPNGKRLKYGTAISPPTKK